MKIEELDRPEYASIPLYPLGDGKDRSLPVFCSRYTSGSDLSPLHRHNVIQINYISRGKLIHQINNGRHELVKGDIFVIPPYVPHQLLPCQGCEFELIELEFEPAFVFGESQEPYRELAGGSSLFDFSYIEPFLVSECNVRPRLNLTGTSQVRVEQLLDEILEELSRQEDSFLLAVRADLLKLLVIVGRLFHESLKNKPEMQLFNHHRDAMLSTLRFIDEHVEDPITIEDAARHALLSQSYFSYLFKLLTGKTFVEYLHALRIKRAMELLTSTEERVLNICYACGFNNINHFNRIFKSIVGLSPTQYRASNRPKKKESVRHDTDRT